VPHRRVGALPRLVLIDGPHRCRCARREQKA
jgi:hypothetical protein